MDSGDMQISDAKARSCALSESAGHGSPARRPADEARAPTTAGEGPKERRPSPESQSNQCLSGKLLFFEKPHVCSMSAIGLWELGTGPPAEAFVYGRRLFRDAYHVSPGNPLRRLDGV
jgi:hypothetical protein